MRGIDTHSRTLYYTDMSLKKIKPILEIVGIFAITSLLVSALFLFFYFNWIAPRGSSPLSTPPSKVLPKDTQFATYDARVNDFLNTLRKGEIETAYKGTSPVFQKKTSLENFKKLVTTLQSSHSIPTSSCSVTEYSEPFSSTIEGLPDVYMIVQTKCEVREGGEIRGFNVEFIDDNGKPKISYINPYTIPVIHKKE